ncbi:MAG: queuosine precursor transporter [Bacteroidia bacterium]|nr:queuosine precursor transporter [Bacteroidia bacterium]
MSHIIQNKPLRVFLILGGIFITNALVAEFIGVKIFSLEKTFGFEPFNITLFGESGLGFNLSAGVLLWPVVFILTDIINEYYGKKGVRFLSIMTAGLIAYAFVMLFMTIRLDPADFWPTSHIPLEADEATIAAITEKVGDYNYAYKLVLGQGMWIIVASLIAFLVGQLVDVFVFHKLKSKTGESKIWLRATGSTLVSQFIDSFVVLFIAFYIGAGWSLVTVLAIGCVNYAYKFLIAVLVTPLIYLAHNIIDEYLGEEVARELKEKAAI